MFEWEGAMDEGQKTEITGKRSVRVCVCGVCVHAGVCGDM